MLFKLYENGKRTTIRCWTCRLNKYQYQYQDQIVAMAKKKKKGYKSFNFIADFIYIFIMLPENFNLSMLFLASFSLFVDFELYLKYVILLFSVSSLFRYI